MNHLTRHLTRLAGLAATILGLVLVTSGHAAAMQPEPGPAGPDSVGQGSGTPSALGVTDSSISVLQWVLFAAVVIGALMIGAALTHLAQRRRVQLAP
jgi:ABC-type cobalamin transport system permease subunit